VIRGVPVPGANLHITRDGFLSANLKLVGNEGKVEVVLRPAYDSIRLQIRDRETLSGVMGAVASEANGVASLRPVGGGLYDLAKVGLPRRLIWLVAPGYCNTLVEMKETEVDSSDIGMIAGTEVTIRASGFESSAVVWLETDESSCWLPEEVVFLPGDLRSVVVPRIGRLSLSGVATCGRTADLEVQVQGAAPMVVDLVFQYPTEEPLVIRNGAGAHGGISAKVRYSDAGGDVLYRSPQGGELQVSKPDKVRMIDVLVQDSEAIRLVPHPGRDKSERCGGVITVDSGQTSRTVFHVRDTSGQPVWGAVVTVRGQDMAEAIRDYPELAGGRPSTHPAWVRQHQPTQEQQVDGSGLAVFGLTNGEYLLEVGLPRALLGAEGPPCSLAATRFRVTGDTSRIVEVSKARRVTVRPIDIRTGEPLSVFRVTADARWFTSGRVFRGPAGQFWLPDAAAEVSVSADGYVSQAIELPTGKDAEHVELSIELQPGSGYFNGEACFVGDDVAKLVGKRVQLIGVRETATSVAREIWKHEVEVVDPARVPFRIDCGGSVSVYAKVIEGGWALVPLQGTWGPGGTVRFSVRRLRKD
jgi:hypothetical protein